MAWVCSPRGVVGSCSVHHKPANPKKIATRTEEDELALSGRIDGKKQVTRIMLLPTVDRGSARIIFVNSLPLPLFLMFHAAFHALHPPTVSDMLLALTTLQFRRKVLGITEDLHCNNHGPIQRRHEITRSPRTIERVWGSARNRFRSRRSPHHVGRASCSPLTPPLHIIL